jgi:Domain of unknown function (DUF5615)
MSQIRLYLDEDSEDLALVTALEERQVDVITPIASARLRRPDEDQLRWATTQNRVIYTCNVQDFYQLHTQFLTQLEPHSGIIMGQHQRYSIGTQLRGLLKLIEVKSAEEMQNQVEFLSSWVNF